MEKFLEVVKWILIIVVIVMIAGIVTRLTSCGDDGIYDITVHSRGVNIVISDDKGNILAEHIYNTDNDKNIGFLGLGGKYNEYKNNSIISKNDKIIITATPVDNKKINKLEINGITYTNGEIYTVTKDITITAEAIEYIQVYKVVLDTGDFSYRIDTKIVTSHAGIEANTTIPYGEYVLFPGDIINIVIEPQQYYRCESLTINNVQYAIKNYNQETIIKHTVDSDVFIKAVITDALYNITVIDPPENVNIEYYLRIDNEIKEGPLDMTTYNWHYGDYLSVVIKPEKNFILFVDNYLVYDSLSSIYIVCENTQQILNERISKIIVKELVNISIDASQEIEYVDLVGTNIRMWTDSNGEHQNNIDSFAYQLYIGHSIVIESGLVAGYNNTEYEIIVKINGTKLEKDNNIYKLILNEDIIIQISAEPIKTTIGNIRLIVNEELETDIYGDKIIVNWLRNGLLCDIKQENVYLRDTFTIEAIANTGYEITSIKVQILPISFYDNDLELINDYKAILRGAIDYNNYIKLYNDWYTIIIITTSPKTFDLTVDLTNCYYSLVNEQGIIPGTQNSELDVQLTDVIKYGEILTLTAWVPENKYTGFIITSVIINGENYNKEADIIFKVAGDVNIEIIAEYNTENYTIFNSSGYDLQLKAFYSGGRTIDYNLEKDESLILSKEVFGIIPKLHSIVYFTNIQGTSIPVSSHNVQTWLINEIKVSAPTENNYIPLTNSCKIEIFEIKPTASINLVIMSSGGCPDLIYELDGTSQYYETAVGLELNTITSKYNIGDSVEINLQGLTDPNYYISNITINETSLNVTSLNNYLLTLNEAFNEIVISVLRVNSTYDGVMSINGLVDGTNKFGAPETGIFMLADNSIWAYYKKPVARLEILQDNQIIYNGVTEYKTHQLYSFVWEDINPTQLLNTNTDYKLKLTIYDSNNSDTSIYTTDYYIFNSNNISQSIFIMVNNIPYF